MGWSLILRSNNPATMGAATSMYMSEGFFTGGPYTYMKYGVGDMFWNCFDAKETHIREDAEEIMRGEGFLPIAFDARFPNQRDTKRCYQNFSITIGVSTRREKILSRAIISKHSTRSCVKTPILMTGKNSWRMMSFLECTKFSEPDLMPTENCQVG